MKKTAIALLAAASLATGAFAAPDLTYNAGDVLLGFRATDPDVTKAYIVNLGHYTNVANYTPSWEGINLSSDLTTVFGTNWSSTTTWGMVAIAQDKKSWASSVLAGEAATITPRTTSFLGTPAANLGAIGSQFGSLTFDAGSAATPGLLTEGVWGESADISWVSYVFNNNFANGSFESESSSNLDFYIAYGSTYGSAGNVLRSTTVKANTFTLNNGTIQSVPEPSTYALFGIGALLLIVAYRRANA